jgi:hypothetical protein
LTARIRCLLLSGAGDTLGHNNIRLGVLVVAGPLPDADCRKLSTHDFFQQLQNAVHAVELVLVEGPHRKIRSETILECEDNRNNIDRCKAPICQQRIVIRERLPITLALKDVL